jgi:hypothetical protein
MKAVLKFNLEFPDERKAHLCCVKSTDMAIVLFEILRNMRKTISNSQASEDYMEGVEDVLVQVQELCEYHGINIDELID